MKLYFVYLRQPGGMSDRRSDPFWEFGSFGQTGCHRHNLLHPTRSKLQNGDRLAFLQGGDEEIRVVGLTPPIEVQRGGTLLGVRWDRSYRPQPYVAAPVLIDNQGDSRFQAIFKLLAGVDRSTYCGQAASKLRSRSGHLDDPELVDQILAWFAKPDLPTISHYLEAISAPSSEWLKRGLAEGWAKLNERERHFAERSGVFPSRPDDVSAEASSAKVSCVRQSSCNPQPRVGEASTGSHTASDSDCGKTGAIEKKRTTCR